MRVSVQVRVPGSGDGERWSRSVYLDTTPRDVAISFDDMHPQGPVTTPTPRVDAIESVLFVVDRTNAKAGSGRRLAVSKMRIVGAGN
jgi:hypothetical protein